MCSRTAGAYMRGWGWGCHDLGYTPFIFGLYIHTMNSQLKARSDDRECTNGRALTHSVVTYAVLGVVSRTVLYC